MMEVLITEHPVPETLAFELMFCPVYLWGLQMWRQVKVSWHVLMSRAQM